MMLEARVHLAGTHAAEQLRRAAYLRTRERTCELTEEVFGPILHVVRYRAADFDQVLQDVADTGFRLTLGVHSRIDDMVERVSARLPVGNVYVNRNMIGAGGGRATLRRLPACPAPARKPVARITSPASPPSRRSRSTRLPQVAMQH